MILVLKRIGEKTSVAHYHDIIGQSGSYWWLWAASCRWWPVTISSLSLSDMILRAIHVISEGYSGVGSPVATFLATKIGRPTTTGKIKRSRHSTCYIVYSRQHWEALRVCRIRFKNFNDVAVLVGVFILDYLYTCWRTPDISAVSLQELEKPSSSWISFSKSRIQWYDEEHNLGKEPSE